MQLLTRLCKGERSSDKLGKLSSVLDSYAVLELIIELSNTFMLNERIYQ